MKKSITMYLVVGVVMLVFVSGVNADLFPPSSSGGSSSSIGGNFSQSVYVNTEGLIIGGGVLESMSNISANLTDSWCNMNLYASANTYDYISGCGFLTNSSYLSLNQYANNWYGPNANVHGNVSQLIIGKGAAMSQMNAMSTTNISRCGTYMSANVSAMGAMQGTGILTQSQSISINQSTGHNH